MEHFINEYSCCSQWEPLNPKGKPVLPILTLSDSDLRLSPDSSTTALGVSLAVALANTPTVGRLESTIPIAS